MATEALSDRHHIAIDPSEICDTDIERFYSFVRKTDSCWLWEGFRLDFGYGTFYFAKTYVRAHRFSWVMHNNKPIPDGKMILHSCDVGACVNPDHLRAGNAEENTADCVERGRKPKGISHYASKLTERQVISIRRDPRGCRKVAVEYGIGASTVKDIRTGKSWAHVQPPSSCIADLHVAKCFYTTRFSIVI